VRVAAPAEAYGSAGRAARVEFFDGPPQQKQAPAKEPAKKPSTQGQARSQECGDKCGGAELGSVECALNSEGLPTDKVEKVVRETDPCIRPCVETHEDVHVKDVEPICKQVHGCLKQAGKDIKKQDKCLDTYQEDLLKKVAGSTGTECKAYQAEEQCLLKRKSKPECKTKDGQARWTEQLERTKCYRDCFCAK
jgi:hypothetical protein